MLDVAPTEFLLVAVVALVVIGPKDLPKAMRVVGYWVGRMRGVARQFRSGFDAMVREAELEEMEKRWAAENERIMKESGHIGSAEADPMPAASSAGEAAGVASPADEAAHAVINDDTPEPIRVERPEIRPAPGDPHSPTDAGVTS